MSFVAARLRCLLLLPLPPPITNSTKNVMAASATPAPAASIAGDICVSERGSCTLSLGSGFATHGPMMSSISLGKTPDACSW